MSGFGFWILFFIVIYECFLSAVKAFHESVRFSDNETNCLSYLMSPKYLTDNQFSASSYSHKFRPSAARLIEVHSQSGPDDGNAWCPKTNIHSTPEEWIEVDFRRMVIIKRIYTMGRADGNFQQFTPQILIKYKRSNEDKWKDYVDLFNKSILKINTDARTKLRSNLQTIIAKRIRIYPINSISSQTIACLKFAFLGCFFEDDAVSYDAPQGDLITIGNSSIDLRDFFYDGQKLLSTLRNGLGLLMDNIAWRNKVDFNSYVEFVKPQVFTGWSCGNRSKDPFIIIQFHFEQERDFKLLTLYSVRDFKHNIYLSGLITVTISNGATDSSVFLNTTNIGDDSNGNKLQIQLNHLKGNICNINITCGINNFVILSEIKIESVAAKSIRTNVSNSPKQPTIHYFNTTDKYTTSIFPDEFDSNNSVWKQQDITAMILVILIILLLIFVIGMAALCYKLQRSRRNKLTKKLELVAQCNSQNISSQTPGTVFTIQSKTPANTDNQQLKYFNETKTAYSAAYSGSQPSDGVYASWPNTDDDPDVATIDKDEEKCLLSAEVGDRSSMKEYATYQCGINSSGANEYLLTDNSLYRPQGNTRSSSIVTTIPNLSTLSVPLLKIVASYETPKTTPMVTYRSNKKLSPNSLESITYQHLLNYRGSCGDVDFRYQPLCSRFDQSNSESNITVIPISSLIPIRQVIRGEYGTISVCNILIEGDHQTAARYFVKNLNIDSKSSIKSSFIIDLQILGSINCTNLVKLESIAVDSDMTNIDLVSVIKSTRFYIIMDYLTGYNLKDFLRNTYYSNVSQDFKLTQSTPYSQISLSSLMIIITQIANGMKHLEELRLTHRDLACRNCMIDLRMHVKIYPGGLVTIKPNEDYCSIEILNHLVTFPLRWMAPESIIGGVFTTKSDVWSFAITMWEIFTLCSLVPYGSLTNEALLDLMSHRNSTPRLPCPQNCPKDIYDLMNRCWNWDESLRPKFVDIHKFLQFKTSNSTSQAQIILPAPPPDDHTS